jgi:hypothetical protein
MEEENCWPYGSQEAERQREGAGTRYILQGLTPSNPLPPTRPHLPIMSSNHESISVLIR